MAKRPWQLPRTRRGWLRPRDHLKKLALLGAFFALLLVKKARQLLSGDVFGNKTHVSEEDVRRKIDAYAGGLISLEELDTWLVEQTWDRSDVPALAREAELLIAETARGDRPDLAEDLRSLVSSPARTTTVLP